MKIREIAACIALLTTAWTDLIAQDSSGDQTKIVVVGNRIEQADAAADQARQITLKPPVDNPLTRHYAPICLKLFGIDAAYGEVIAEQVLHNVRILGLHTSRPGCEPNVWIGFVRDSKAEVAQLRKQHPVMFSSLKSFEIERIFAGSGAVQVWHATEIRGIDGRPIPIVKLNIGGEHGPRDIETGYNAQYQTGRLASPIRSDINGTIVVFDSNRANGKTVQQLADYATFRILAPVQDFAEMPPRGMPTILTLFTPGGDPPGGLTEFDWAYLSAYYKLDRGAKVTAVHDTVKQAVLDGTGQRLREKSGGE